MACEKLNALTRVAQYMNTEKMRLIINSFFSQFIYCLITCMFHNRSLNHKVTRLHERCLRVIYNDGHSRQFCVNTPQEFTGLSNINV